MVCLEVRMQIAFPVDHLNQIDTRRQRSSYQLGLLFEVESKSKLPKFRFSCIPARTN
jgi:hypothetical protein